MKQFDKLKDEYYLLQHKVVSGTITAEERKRLLEIKPQVEEKLNKSIKVKK